MKTKVLQFIKYFLIKYSFTYLYGMIRNNGLGFITTGNDYKSTTNNNTHFENIYNGIYTKQRHIESYILITIVHFFFFFFKE